jgi:hypothetical protein
VRDPDSLKVEVGDHGVDRATRGSSTQCGQSSRRRLLRGGDSLPRRGVEEALRLNDSASKCVSRGVLVLPGEGNHTHALLAAAASVLVLSRAAARALSAAATEMGRGDSPQRKAVAEKGPAAGGIP